MCIDDSEMIRTYLQKYENAEITELDTRLIVTRKWLVKN